MTGNQCSIEAIGGGVVVPSLAEKARWLYRPHLDFDFERPPVRHLLNGPRVLMAQRGTEVAVD
jgi:hypothetical protein